QERNDPAASTACAVLRVAEPGKGFLKLVDLIDAARLARDVEPNTQRPFKRALIVEGIGNGLTHESRLHAAGRRVLMCVNAPAVCVTPQTLENLQRILAT